MNAILKLCYLSLLTTVMSASLSAKASDFSVEGKISAFEFTPESYTGSHFVYYYIPASFKKDRTAPAMVLLHGGGLGTNSLPAAKKTALAYIQSFTEMANRKGMLLVAPVSTIGWNYPTSYLMKELVGKINSEVRINTDRIILYGHSMGGMGITREAPYMIDLFSGFMPAASGMQESHQTEPALRTFFDTLYIQLNGKLDHFKEFLTLSDEVREKMANLESSFNLKSGFSLVTHWGDHGNDPGVVEGQLNSYMLKTKRKIYRKHIFPVFGRTYSSGSSHSSSPDIDATHDSYYWLQAKQLAQRTDTYQVSGEATCKNNTYTISLDDPEMNVLSLRVLVSSKMVDLKKPIRIVVDGKEMFKGHLKKHIERTREIIDAKRDEQFVFDTYVDLVLNHEPFTPPEPLF